MLLNKAQIEAEIVRLRKKLSLIGMFDTPGMIAIGIALFALFSSANPSSLHPLLGDKTFVYALLGIGVIWVSVCLKVLINTVNQLKELRAKLSQS